ncbi:MAG: TolC family protein [Candidatus Omnitrophica bacterium]|jgi:outer membrane protein TolC|nr:TolC family protein [Candidatus Omnitrophota bacterium]
MIKKSFIFILIIMFILSSSSIFAEQPLFLEALIKEVRESNLDILAAKKRWEASLLKIPQAKSLDNPNVDFSFMKIQKGTIKLDKTMPEDRVLSISQMFPLFGKLTLKGKIAFIESQISASEYKDKELEVINKLKNTYYDLFMNYKVMELNQDSLRLLETIAKIAEAKYTVGNVGQEEISKMNLEIARLSNNIINLKQERSSKETQINALLNRPLESKLTTPELKEDLSFNQDVSPLYQLALQNQPELLIFSYVIEKNKHAKSLAKRNLLPDLMTEIGLRGITSGGIGPWDLMLAFSVPFWFWTKQRYEIKEAIANLEEAEIAYQAIKNVVFSKIKDLLVQIDIAKNKLNLYKHNLVPLLENSISASLSAYRSGKGDLMLLLDTERMLIETKIDYYNVLVEYNARLSDLERYIGISLSEVK